MKEALGRAGARRLLGLRSLLEITAELADTRGSRRRRRGGSGARCGERRMLLASDLLRGLGLVHKKREWFRQSRPTLGQVTLFGL